MLQAGCVGVRSPRVFSLRVGGTCNEPDSFDCVGDVDLHAGYALCCRSAASPLFEGRQTPASFSVLVAFLSPMYPLNLLVWSRGSELQ